ncbi:MAG: Tat pathway signal protein [Chloroflexi bacterium]|nr:Tat pathway signal protein [Chloroflexota bacterium]
MSATKQNDLIWGLLLHLSYNMWADRDVPDWHEHVSYRPYLRFDESLWNDLLHQAAEAGANMILLDLGDGVVYDSHPEIAVEGAWSPAKLRHELQRVRELGLEPIPKLNFSTSHDAWLGPYSRCVSTNGYYAVCRDLIREIVDLFEGPRFFHLGMDEETAEHQRHYEYVVIRQHDLWWHDLLFYVEQVEAAGSRAWIWSDYVWRHPEAFYARMPTTVLQSNWYYRAEFAPDIDRVRAFLELEEHGYDQIPTGSNWVLDQNLPDMVRFCTPRITPAHLKGYLQTIWRPTLESCRGRHEHGIAALREAKRVYLDISR